MALVFGFCVTSTGQAQAQEILKLEADVPNQEVLAQRHEKMVDLTLAPNETETLTFWVTNLTAQQQVAQISVGTGTTMRNGQLDFVRQKQLINAGDLPFYLGDALSSSQDNVTLAPYGKASFTVTITMPEVSFNGEVLGGVAVVPNGTTDLATSQQVPILVRQGTNPAPAVSLAASRLADGHVEMRVINTELLLMQNITITSQLLAKGGKVLAEKTFEKASLSPLGDLTWTAKDNKQTGRRVVVTLKSEGWEKRLTRQLPREQADTQVRTKSVNWLNWGAGVVGVLLMLSVVFSLVRRIVK
jgi:hypothetical protein